jgi:hypothetical protein
VPHEWPQLSVPHTFPMHEPHAYWQVLLTHVCGLLHVPHEIVPPHPSEALPQVAPMPAHVFGTHGPCPHTFGVPPPPQVSPGWVQVPHDRVPPHPSGREPQFLPSAVHVVGVQPQTLGMPPPPHVWSGCVQPPQSRVEPQPSEIVPHAEPHCFGTHGPWPQTFAMPPPPHVSPGFVHAPQSSVPPHPSGVVPQSLPRAEQELGAQLSRPASNPASNATELSGAATLPSGEVPASVEGLPSSAESASVPPASDEVVPLGWVTELEHAAPMRTTADTTAARACMVLAWSSYAIEDVFLPSPSPGSARSSPPRRRTHATRVFAAWASLVGGASPATP